MKTQQAAEREEQQRIKSLVLNYDLRDGEEQQEGNFTLSTHRNLNIHTSSTGLEKAATHSRLDKPARSGQRARKLQLSDVTDWYEPAHKANVSHAENPLQCVPKSNQALSVGSLNSSLPRASQREKPRPRTNGRGRLTRREIEQEHASRKAASTGNS